MCLKNVQFPKIKTIFEKFGGWTMFEHKNMRWKKKYYNDYSEYSKTRELKPFLPPLYLNSSSLNTETYPPPPAI